MGAIIDLTPRLIREAKARGAVSNLKLLSLRMAERYVWATRQEMSRQMDTLCDANATPLMVEEATNAIPLLEELLRERLACLHRLEQNIFDWPERV